jgi:N6-adenosine-specific RNA methylase IME4
MKTKLLLLIAPTLLLSSCDKSAVGQTSKDDPQATATSTGDLEELMKLPDSSRMMNLWVNHKGQEIPTDAFDVEPPKVTVKKLSKDLFEVSAIYEATAKTDLYSFPVPTLIDENGKIMSYMVTRLLDRKGTKKIRTFQCQVRYGPKNWGRNPQKVMWNWEKPMEGGDKMEIYKMGGSREWATAETLNINPDGKSSSNPEILILDTPDYLKAVEKHPKLAVSAEQRAKEEAERFQQIYEAMPRKTR